MSLWKLFQNVWKTENIPESWYNSKVIQLPKGRTPINQLQNMRHIHDRDETFKFFGQIVTDFAKSTIIDNMSKFRLACRPGHRPSEHLFVVKSIFALYNANNKGLLISSFDLKTFFDSEDIFDCMDALYRRNIKGKIYRLLFNMNKNVRIQVKQWLEQQILEMLVQRWLKEAWIRLQ